MLKRLSVGRRQNGQGIVEYALLLAFILAIAIAMQGSGIDEAISDTFTRVAQALGVETEQDRWASMSEADLRAIDNDVRLAEDVKFLNSIKKKLIGKSETEIKNMLGTGYVPNDKSSVLLGTFSYNEDGYNFYLTRGGSDKLNDLSIFGFSSVEDGKTQRYFFSDYALDNINNPYTKSLGVKAEHFDFDKTTGKLKDVEIVINPNYTTSGQNRKEDSTTGRNNGLTTDPTRMYN